MRPTNKCVGGRNADRGWRFPGIRTRRPTRIPNRRLRDTGGRAKKLHTNVFTLWKDAESGLPITIPLGDCAGNAKA